MTLTLQLDDAQAKLLSESFPDLSRAAIEALALEGYRSGRLGGGQVRRLLGFSTPMEVHAFLKEHGVYLNYTLEELEKDRITSDRFKVDRQGNASNAA